MRSMLTTDVVVGVDVGTTTIKAIVTDVDGNLLGHAAEPTPWIVQDNGYVHTDIDEFSRVAISVIAAAAEGASTPTHVIGIGIAGLAETGVVVDSSGKPLTPAMAWYDQRGKFELEQLPQAFRDEFSAVTGLAAKAECSFSKLLWLTQHGFTLAPGMQWMNALEYIAYALTGERFTEPSLASRTGLIAQSDVSPWSGTLDLIGAPADFIPQFRNAGHAFGVVAAHAPEKLRGAAVTVAGHDHLVASVGAGAIGGDDLFDSCGTADVIVRAVPRTLTDAERGSLVAGGLSAGRHVLPGRTAVLGATRSGLVLGRVLSMLGAMTREERARLSEAWTPQWGSAGTVLVSEPPNWTNEVTVQLLDDASPEEVWCAALDYTLAQTRQVLDPVTTIAGTFQTAVAAGGWAHVPGVFRGKQHIMPGLTRSNHSEPGARGASLFAAHAAGVTPSPFTADLLADASAAHTTIKEFTS